MKEHDNNVIDDYGDGNDGLLVDTDGRILNIVVTGANRGLGFAIANEMVALGHRTVLACRDKQKVSL